jgi:prolyl-tRNA synthetase
MTHGDDDGLVLPPRLAARHAVILPIYRHDQERSEVLQYCHRLQQELASCQYDGEPLRIALDDRDLRGGEKVWHHIKRGVPLRIEVGPRDVVQDAVVLARRDQGSKEKGTMPRQELAARAVSILTEIQTSLFQRALRLRETNTHRIDDLNEFRELFSVHREKQIHGGFALCHWAEDPAVEDTLADLKVTIRCVPIEQEDEPGTCIFTGKASRARALFAKAY